MKTYDYVHLIIYAAGGKVEGRTKLQKLVYFSGVLTKQEESLGYRAHFYGPYSPDVADAVDKLRALKFLQQTIAGGNAIDSRGFEVARYDYELTDDGRQIAEEKANYHPKSWKVIQAAVNRLVKSDHNDYVKLAIAAKTYFMTGKLKEATSSKDLEKLSSQFGWKVTSNEISEAFEWLKTIRLVDERRIPCKSND